MCESHADVEVAAVAAESRPTPRAVSRRGLLGGLGVLAAGAGILGIAGPAVAAQTVPGGQGQPTDYSQGARVVLLGTAGGPPPNRNRCGISSALVVDGAVYLIDAGRGPSRSTWPQG